MCNRLFYNRVLTKILMISLCIFCSIQGFSQSTPDNPYSVKWENGVKFKSADNHFNLGFGGRIQQDFAFFSQDDTLANAFGKLNNGVEFRRVRFYNSGIIYNSVKYCLQLDFSHGTVTFDDVFIELQNIPLVGHIKIGHFLEPMRLESITSDKYNTFMEHSLTFDYTAERNTGIMLHNTALKSKMTWAIGAFRNANSAGDDNVAGDGLNITARITGAPLYNKDKNQVLHLGIAYSHRNPYSNTYQIKSKPEAHLANVLINTGSILNVQYAQILEGEAALVMGPFSVQSELMHAGVVTGNANYSFMSYYAYASFFLTGESRPYSLSNGAFGRLSPKKNALDGNGSGAWEIALRYAQSNLNSKDVMGGKMRDITVGLNWYLNPCTRFMFNYVNSKLFNTGYSNIFEIRSQIDF